MDVSTLLLALPIFFVLYGGVGLMLQSRRNSSSWSGRQRAGSVRKSLQEFSTLAGRLGFNQAFLRLKGLRQRLDLLLVRSGHPFAWKAEDVLFYKELLAVLAAVALWQSGQAEPLFWPVVILLGFWLPDLALQIRGSNRRVAMQRQLPALVDLLALAVESGLDLVVSLERIYERMKPAALRDEIQTMLQESRLGASRKDILQRWAHRTGLSDAQSLASLIVQSEEMGSPLAGVLRNYAEDMRTRRVLRAEELAGKIPVKILFPMLVFFFPIVFVIILGPVAMDFLKGYK